MQAKLTHVNLLHYQLAGKRDMMLTLKNELLAFVVARYYLELWDVRIAGHGARPIFTPSEFAKIASVTVPTSRKMIAMLERSLLVKKALGRGKYTLCMLTTTQVALLEDMVARYKVICDYA